MTENIDSFRKAAASYCLNWEIYQQQHNLQNFQPTAIGWKVRDLAEFNSIVAQLLSSGRIEQVHIGEVDQRYIAAILFKDPIIDEIRILKLMQRKKGSDDPVGLDHVDFYAPELSWVENKLIGIEADWKPQSNDAHAWVSLRWDGNEAKFVDHTVLDVGAAELTAASQDILSK